MRSIASRPKPRSAIVHALAACVLTAATLFFGACNKSGGSTGPGPKPVKTDPPALTLETGSLYGRITDESGAGLAGVKVAAGSKSALTDADGLFLLDDAQVPRGRAVILASKAGYYDGARAEVPGTGGRTRFELKLMKKEFVYSVPAADGGKVEVKDGAAVVFQGGSFVTASGAAYTGSVKVAARYLDPDSSSFYDFFAGDNQGWGADAEYAALVSLGVLRVDIQGAGGQPLTLSEGKPAALTYPQASTVSGPDKIPLWYFDAAIGQWREEGFATLKDGVYSGEVAHFSDWNLDYKGGVTWDYCVNVTCGGKPVSGVKVTTFQKVGVSDSAGGLCFVNVAADRPTNTLEIRAGDNAGKAFMNKATVINVVLKAEERPTFTLELDSECPGSVQGLVTGCGGEPIEAMVSVRAKQGLQFTNTVKGRFHLTLPTDSGWTLHASDAAGHALVPPLALKPVTTGEFRELGSVKICSTGTTDYIDVALDTTDFVYGSSGLPGVGAFPGWGISPDGSLLGYGTEPGHITLLDVKTGTARMRLDNAYRANATINAVFTRDNTRMLTHIGDSLTIWDISAGSFRLVSQIRPATLAEFSDDGKTLFVASRTGNSAILYETETGLAKDTLHPANFAVPGDNDSPRIKLMPADDAFAYFVNSTGIFRVWSLSGDTLVREIKTAVSINTEGTYQATFSPSGRTLCVSKDANFINVFDVTTGALMRRMDLRDLEGINNGVSGEGTIPKGSVSDAYYFRQAKIAADEVVQVIDFRDSILTAVLPTPKFGNQRSYHMKLGHEGKILATRVLHPADVRLRAKDGFRIYKLE